MKANVVTSRYVLPAVLQNVYQRPSLRLYTSPATQASSSSVQAKPLSEIPGLSSLPIIGPLHHFLPVVYRAEDPNPLRPGFESMVNYKTKDNMTVADGVFGLTILQGAQWRQFRTKVNPALLKPKLVKLYAPALEGIAKDMVERLTKLSYDYLENNFDVEMTKFSLESIGLVGLGSRLGALGDDMTDDHPARKLMKCAKDILQLSFKLEVGLSPWRYISTPTYRKLMRTVDTQWEVSKVFIGEARKQITERGHDIPEEEKSIIEKLLAIDEKVAISMANEMLLAGIDTVAFATTNLLYRLGTNPKAQDKLREEILSGDNNRRYLRACLKEALRLNPVVSANLRHTAKDHYVAGYHIPKGVDVVAPNEYLSKLEKYYPQPTEFIPERWLVEKTHPLYYGNAHPMVTLPFGFGVRSCIGRRIAELEIELLVATLVKDYLIRWEGPPLKIVTRIMNKMEKPYNFRFDRIN
ncbi:cytochrome P450 CYP12A2-like isoform X2 [Pectinophora gossypiella]|uniref:cytochrome P450 CYP12A2-like isoform X2 n=1 Tax=Pectinophora gossypiella TaxID=13191 RepID=UPI00214F25AF|nr:cytochrome P450 CYP12A2-like isoform X2 [Pectinophora gossypiella]